MSCAINIEPVYHLSSYSYVNWYDNRTWISYSYVNWYQKKLWKRAKHPEACPVVLQTDPVLEKTLNLAKLKTLNFIYHFNI